MEFRFVLAAICLTGLMCLGECHKKRNQTADSDEYQTLFDSIQQKVQQSKTMEYLLILHSFHKSRSDRRETFAWFPEHHKRKNSGSESRASSGSDSDERDSNNGDMFQIFTQVSGSLVPSSCQADSDCAASDMVCSRFLGKCVSPASKSQNGTKALAACGAQVCSNDSDCCAGQVCDSYNGLLSVNRCRQGDAGQGSVSVSVNGAKAALKPQKNSSPQGKAASKSSSADESASSSAEAQPAQVDSAAQQPANAVSYAKSAKAQAPVRTAQPDAQLQNGSDTDTPVAQEVQAPAKPVKPLPAASGVGGSVGVKSAGKSRGRVQQQSYANAQPDESDAGQQASNSSLKPAGPSRVPVVLPPQAEAVAENSDDNAAQQDNNASSATGVAPAVTQAKQSAKNNQKQTAQNSGGQQQAGAASASPDGAEEGSGAAASDNQDANAPSQQPPVPPAPLQAASGNMNMGNNDGQMQAAESVGHNAQATSGVRAASSQNAAPLRTKSKSAPVVDASNTDNAAAAAGASDNGQDEQIQLSMFQTNGAAPPKVLLSSKTGFQRKSNKGKAKEAPAVDAQSADAAPSVVPPGVPGRYRD